jgi:hypothetical protein
MTTCILYGRYQAFCITTISIYMVGQYESSRIRLHLYDFYGFEWLDDCNITTYVKGGWISGSVISNIDF